MKNAHRPSALVALVAALLPFASSIGAQQRATPLDSATLASLSWRNIGPADMGGRIADIVGIPSPSKTFYVAVGCGRHLEDDERGDDLPSAVRRSSA